MARFLLAWVTMGTQVDLQYQQIKQKGIQFVVASGHSSVDLIIPRKPMG